MLTTERCLNRKNGSIIKWRIWTK